MRRISIACWCWNTWRSGFAIFVFLDLSLRLQGGELFSRVGASNYDLTEEKCKRFTVDLIKALNFIHERQIIHLDLKPQNIMMKNKKDEFHIKLIDFGLAKRLDRGRVRTGFVGTVGFMAPEVANSQYGGHERDFATTATDLFSLGVIIYMLVSGGLEPFWDGNDVRAIKNTLRKEVSFAHSEFHGVSEEGKDFIKSKFILVLYSYINSS
jgi:serine/threonine protein kinase